MSANARQSALAFVAARKSGRAIDSYPGSPPKNLREAYAVQDAALALWQRSVGGWKVGRISGPDARRLGADRLVGPAFADTIFEETAQPAAMKVFAGGFAAAEAEFMLRLAPQPDRDLPRTAREAMRWVDAVRIGVEIASSPYPKINADGPCVTVSDHGNNAGLLIGRPVGRERWETLSEIEVDVSVAGRTVGNATTATMLDGPFGAVRFLLENLFERNIDLQAGWWISSGATRE